MNSQEFESAPYNLILTHLIGRDHLLRLEHRATATRTGGLARHGLRRLLVRHELGPAHEIVLVIEGTANTQPTVLPNFFTMHVYLKHVHFEP